MTDRPDIFPDRKALTNEVVREKLRSAESYSALVRLAIIIINAVAYSFLMDRDEHHPFFGLAHNGGLVGLWVLCGHLGALQQLSPETDQLSDLIGRCAVHHVLDHRHGHGQLAFLLAVVHLHHRHCAAVHLRCHGCHFNHLRCHLYRHCTV
jgi:hypothetical protein